MQLPVLSVLCLHLIAVGIAALVRLRGQKIINFGEGRPAIEVVRVMTANGPFTTPLQQASAWPVPHGLVRPAGPEMPSGRRSSS